MKTQTFSNREENELLLDKYQDNGCARRVLSGALFYVAEHVETEMLYNEICKELDVIPDFSMDAETETIPLWWRSCHLCQSCDWIESFDIIEAFYRLALAPHTHLSAKAFEDAINRKFQRYKCDWELIDGKVTQKKNR